jgi:hypothetical protein
LAWFAFVRGRLNLGFGGSAANPATWSQLRQIQSAQEQLQLGRGEEHGFLARLRPALESPFM